MKIAVVGSREFKDIKFIETILLQHFDGQLLYGDILYTEVLISGGARGVDSIAESFWKKHNGKTIIFKPDWDKYGKRAGFLRNELIINEAERVIAFWDGESKGTKHSIDLAIKKGIPVDIYIRK